MKGGGCPEAADTETPLEPPTNDDSDKAESTRSLLHKNAQGTRGKLEHWLNTNKFQICIMCLVIVDCLLVICELLIDLNIGSPQSAATGVAGADPKLNGTITQRKVEGANLIMVVTALHICSIAIVATFVVEMFVKVVVYGKRLIYHKMEIVDGVIVVVTFALDVSLSDGTGAISGIGLLIALRLWRVTKILNGIVMSVKKHSDRQLTKEKTWRLAMEEELTRLTGRCAAQEREIEALRLLLLKSGLELPASLAAAAQPADGQCDRSEASTGGGDGGAGDRKC